MDNHVVDNLRLWSANLDDSEHAAFTVLDEHGHWLSNEAFVKACVRVESDGFAYLSWDAAVDAEGDLPGSPEEMAILRLALFLAQDPFSLSSLDWENRELVVREFANALGVQR